MTAVYFRLAASARHGLERAPELERLLARAGAPRESSDWRAQAFRVIAPEAVAPPAVATAVAAGARPLPLRGGAMSGCVATPVQLVAGMTSVGLPLDGILELDAAEADLLVSDFERVFAGGGMHLIHGRDTRLLLASETQMHVASVDPEQMLGRDLGGFLPSGADAAPLRRLLSEIEMWLHSHAVNELRRRRAAAPVSGLWLWGAGSLDAPLPPVSGWTAGRDPLFGAFGARDAYPGAAAGSGVVVVAESPGSAGWHAIEESWLAPAVADLRAGRLERLDLSGGNRCLSVTPWGARRFWRRARAWWMVFDVGGVLDE